MLVEDHSEYPWACRSSGSVEMVSSSPVACRISLMACDVISSLPRESFEYGHIEEPKMEPKGFDRKLVVFHFIDMPPKMGGCSLEPLIGTSKRSSASARHYHTTHHIKCRRKGSYTHMFHIIDICIFRVQELLGVRILPLPFPLLRRLVLGEPAGPGGGRRHQA